MPPALPGFGALVIAMTVPDAAAYLLTGHARLAPSQCTAGKMLQHPLNLDACST